MAVNKGEPPDGDAVAGMVRACRPTWRVREYDPVDEGTDFVARVACATPEGDRTAVLKATTAGFVTPEIARAEPRLYEFVGRETDVPVPAVYGFVDDHDTYPAPFYLLEHVDGENVEGRYGTLAPAARERIVREAGTNLAALHDLGTLPRVGKVGVRDGDLAVLDGEHGPVDEFREWFRAGVAETCDALAAGTYFPDHADEPERFADLAEPLRAELRARTDALSEPEPPCYCHWDYRYGNLLVDPDTGETWAVLDWANLTAAEPAYNLAKVESHLFDDHEDGPKRAASLRRTFRDAYETAREKTARERQHRAFVADYL